MVKIYNTLYEADSQRQAGHYQKPFSKTLTITHSGPVRSRLSDDKQSLLVYKERFCKFLSFVVGVSG